MPVRIETSRNGAGVNRPGGNSETGEAKRYVQPLHIGPVKGRNAQPEHPREFALHHSFTSRRPRPHNALINSSPKAPNLNRVHKAGVHVSGRKRQSWDGASRGPSFTTADRASLVQTQTWWRAGVAFSPAGQDAIQDHLEQVISVGGAAVLDWHLEQSNPSRLNQAGPALLGALDSIRDKTDIWWPTPAELTDWWQHRAVQRSALLETRERISLRAPRHPLRARNIREPGRPVKGLIVSKRSDGRHPEAPCGWPAWRDRRRQKS